MSPAFKCWLVGLLLVAAALSSRATVPEWDSPGSFLSRAEIGPATTGYAVCQAWMSDDLTGFAGNHGTGLSATNPGVPASTAATNVCSFQNCNAANSCVTATSPTFGAYAGPGTAVCAGLPTMDILGALGASTSNAGGLMCVNNCAYYNGGATLVIGSSTNSVMGKAVSVGLGCLPSTSSGNGPVAVTGNCYSSSGVSTCANSSAATGSVGNDLISPAVAPAVGTCQQYASGGVVCNGNSGTMTTPPAPGSGTTVSTPTATVFSGSTTLEYFSSTVVNASSNTVQTTNTTQGSALPGTQAGVAASSGSGSGTTYSASNGDCAATGVNCSGDSAEPTLPGTLTGCASYEACFQTFWTNIQGAPIPAAVTALETSWPSGSCPDMPITFATLPGHSFDYATQFCSVWTSSVAPALSAVTMIVWSLAGIFIMLSA